MAITDVTIIHHVGIVFLLLFGLSEFGCCHPVAYLASLVYLYLVHERHMMRVRRKIQFEERKQANQRRVLTDSETVRWLNHAVEKIWPVCVEQIVSQKILLPIIPWFLEKYKPWTAKEAKVQQLYMGRNPPLITDMRVLNQTAGDDHLVLQLGLNFVTAEDMLAVLDVKLRKRLGFGMWAKMHITGMHIEGKVLVGVKFLGEFPYIARLRVCFVEPPYFQMTCKPIINHGLDFTELPGIAGWLDKLLSIAFEQTLVQPNMLTVDVQKFIAPEAGNWFTVDEKEPIAIVKIEVIEGAEMQPSDLNGLADPYVKARLGSYKFRTKIQKKTLAPKWHEEFKIPIFTWETLNSLIIQVHDKDHIYDDFLGGCCLNIANYRDGQRHDFWVSLLDIKTGRLRLAVTVLGDSATKVDDLPPEVASKTTEDLRNSFSSGAASKNSFSSVSSDKSPRVSDNIEPINIEGHENVLFVHQPGSEVSDTWEPRKGKLWHLDTKEVRNSFGRDDPAASRLTPNDTSSTDETVDGDKSKHRVRSGLRKIGSVFRRNKPEDQSGVSTADPAPSPVPSPLAVNVKPVGENRIGVNFVIEGDGPKTSDKVVSPDRSGGGASPTQGHMKGMAKSIMKHAGNSARGLKHVLSRKGSNKFLDIDPSQLSDSSDDGSAQPQAPHHPVIPNTSPRNSNVRSVSSEDRKSISTPDTASPQR
uniref:C2 domain-containing protein n=2 Tax=Kalanchoe fedtschenkoi TaxID=63787 RepID=A0A7N0TJF8_KALFE